LNYLNLNAYGVVTNGYHGNQSNQRTVLSAFHLTVIARNGSLKNNNADLVRKHQASEGSQE